MASFLRVRFQILAGLAIGSSVIFISMMFYIRTKYEDALLPTRKLLHQHSREIYSQPKVGANQLIFVESSCSGTDPESAKNVVRLNSDQACALESAAKSNPSTPVYLFHLCPLDDGSLERSSPLVNQLFASYENLYVWHESLESLLRHSIIQEFSKPSNMSSSKHNVIHFSDLLRYFLLWKYGGTYLDLDFIVTRSLDTLAADFIALESAGQANGAAIRVRVEGAGHAFVERCLREMHSAFTGRSRQETGPALVNGVLKEFCNVTELLPTKNGCKGLAIYPPIVFYAVPYWHWRQFYPGTEVADGTLTQVAQSHAVHLWGSMMYLDGVDKEFNAMDRVGKDHPKAVLSQKYCPIAYRHKSVQKWTDNFTLNQGLESVDGGNTLMDERSERNESSI